MSRSATSRGGRKAGKRKETAPALLRVDELLPVSSSIEVSRQGNFRVAKDFKLACANRAVLLERLFDEQTLVDIGFPYLQRLKDWKWWPLFVNDHNAQTNIVKAFYFRGDVQEYEAGEDDEDVVTRRLTGRFRSGFLGDVITVDEALIRNYVGDDLNEGATEIPNENDFPYLEASREILNDPDLTSTEEMKAGNMELNNRILHLMVCQVLFPRGGDFSKARRKDIFIMHRIIHGPPLNLSGLIFTRMMEGVRSCKTDGNSDGLPYARLVTKICSDVFNIHPDEPKAEAMFKTPFDKRSIGSLGWKLDSRTNKYVRRARHNEDTSTPEPLTMEALLQSLQEMNDQNMNEIRGSLGNLTERLTRVENNQSRLSAQHERLFAEIQAARTSTHLTDPFPSLNNP